MQAPKISTLNQINDLSSEIESLKLQLHKLVSKLEIDTEVKKSAVTRHEAESRRLLDQQQTSKNQKQDLIELQKQESLLIPQYSQTIINEVNKYLNSDDFFADIDKIILKVSQGSAHTISLIVDPKWKLSSPKILSITPTEGKVDECILSIGEKEYIFSKQQVLDEISVKLYNSLISK